METAEQGTQQGTLAAMIAAKRAATAQEQQRQAAQRAAEHAEHAERRTQWRQKLAALWSKLEFETLFGPAHDGGDELGLRSAAVVVDGVPVSAWLNFGYATNYVGSGAWIKCGLTSLLGAASDSSLEWYVELDRDPIIDHMEKQRWVMEQTELVLQGHRKLLEQKQRRAQLRELARTYAVSAEESNAQGKAWAERWQQALWQPTPLWLVRYLPVGMYQDEDGEPDDEMQSCVVWEHPEAIGLMLRTGMATVTKVSQAGSTTRLLLPNLVDAELLPVAMPSIDARLDYHRHLQHGKWHVNLPQRCPPEQELAATNDRPARLDRFIDYLEAQAAPDLARLFEYIDEDWRRIALWTDDEL